MKKILLVTMDFPPLVGGIANYYFNRVNKMSVNDINDIVVLMNKVLKCQSVKVSSVKVIYKNFFTKLIWPRWLPLIWHIWRIIKKENINKIWVGQVLPVGTAAWLVVKLLNKLDSCFRRNDKKLTFFVTCHGNDLIRTKSVPRKYQLTKKILQDAEYVEANTQFTKNILIKDFGFGKDKIHPVKSSKAGPAEREFDRVKVVYPECSLNKNMVDMRKVDELRKKYGLRGKEVLLTVARLVKSKGIEQIVKALPKVWEKVPGLVYVIVGDGPEKNDLVELAERLAPGSTWSHVVKTQQGGDRLAPVSDWSQDVKTQQDGSSPRRDVGGANKSETGANKLETGANKAEEDGVEVTPSFSRRGGAEGDGVVNQDAATQQDVKTQQDGSSQETGANKLETGANKRIIFIGNVPHNELANYYALADLFILTPRRIASGDTESFGIVYLEAKEFVLPIIAGDVGGVREISYDKMTLVDSENVDEIAQEIKNQISKIKNTNKK